MQAVDHNKLLQVLGSPDLGLDRFVRNVALPTRHGSTILHANVWVARSGEVEVECPICEAFVTDNELHLHIHTEACLNGKDQELS
jgi:hypothetical protein